ncbi:MAG: hypothetical protein HeimC2_41490 [Candidatus Heimdallarchaeota archaeon LC_2]|nr:MAG: hypothetical protein HeimC2_41490 [Candidatus Heimdallarchaeota archaeon LC_2]
MSKIDQQSFIVDVDQKQLTYEIASIVKVYLLIIVVLWAIILSIPAQIFDMDQFPDGFYLILFSIPALFTGYKYGIYNGEFEKIIQVKDTDIYLQSMIETLHKMQFDMTYTNYNLLTFTSRKVRHYKERILVSINPDINQIKHDMTRPTYKTMISRIKDSLSLQNKDKHFRKLDPQSEGYGTDNLKKTIEERRCCKMNGRNGDRLCNICGRGIPDEYIVNPQE